MRWPLFGFCLLIGVAVVLSLPWSGILASLFSDNYLPHRFCYLAQPGLIWTTVFTDAAIALACATIFVSLLWIASRLRGAHNLGQYVWIFLSFGLFIAACGLTHVMGIVTVWWPIYPMAAAVNLVCAVASLPTGILFALRIPAIEANLRRYLQLSATTRDERDHAVHALAESELRMEERRRHNEELSAASAKLESFRVMIDAVVDYAIFRLDPQGIIMTWNLGGERIKGYTPEEIVGRHFSILYPPEAIAEGLPERTLLLARAEGRYEEEGWRLRKDNSRFWASVTVTALHDAEGNLTGFGKVTRDLTERRLAEEALLEFNRRQAEDADKLASAYTQLNSVLECTSDCVMTIGRDWTILYGNRRAIDTLPDCVVGFNYWACFPSALGSPSETILRRAMESRTETGYERFFEPYGIWFKVRIFPSEVGISAFFTEITEEKKLREQIALDQVMREKRIEALSHMAGGLAHEISNPLAIIHARASDLKALSETVSLLPAEQVMKASDSIVHTADRAIRILRGLRGFGREASNDPMEWASIEAIVDQCLEMQQSRFERHGIALRIDLHPDLPLVLCRETQIGQILTNLLNNAFDAVDQSDVTERWVTLTAARSKETVSIHVTDSGPGIDDELRPHLMEPFFTTKAKDLGMGIGLSLSRAIAQEHGGSLALCHHHMPTCFELILPLDATVLDVTVLDATVLDATVLDATVSTPD